jgi:hypothetical protein
MTIANRAGVGAIAYVEYARRLLPDPGESQDDAEINHLTAAMIPGNIMSLLCDGIKS